MQRIILLLCVLGALCFSDSLLAGVPAAHRLVIRETGGVYTLSVPASRLLITVPKGGLVARENRQGGATDNPRYFFLEDGPSGIVLSGWFEPAERFNSLESSWGEEMASLRGRGFNAPEGVTRTKKGDWNVILYNIPLPGGSSSHIRASCVRAGTWIDMHISVSSVQSAAETRQQVMSLMESIAVLEKKGK